MTARLTTVEGADVHEVSPAAVHRLFDDLDRHRDEPDASVSVAHESEWYLQFFHGMAVLENVEADAGTERHLRGLTRGKQIALATALIDGRLDEVFAERWIPGYGS